MKCFSKGKFSASATPTWVWVTLIWETCKMLPNIAFIYGPRSRSRKVDDLRSLHLCFFRWSAFRKEDFQRQPPLPKSGWLFSKKPLKYYRTQCSFVVQEVRAERSMIWGRFIYAFFGEVLFEKKILSISYPDSGEWTFRWIKHLRNPTLFFDRQFHAIFIYFWTRRLNLEQEEPIAFLSIHQRQFIQTFFDAVTSIIIDSVISLYPSVEIVIPGDFNVDNQKWLGSTKTECQWKVTYQWDHIFITEILQIVMKINIPPSIKN